MSLFATRNISEISKLLSSTEGQLANNSNNNSNINDINSTSEHDMNEFLNVDNESNLTATITSIRTNVTRVLYMYFQNITDEFGYGAATTEKTTTTTSTTTIAARSGGSSSNTNNNIAIPNTIITTSTISPAATPLQATATTTTTVFSGGGGSVSGSGVPSGGGGGGSNVVHRFLNGTTTFLQTHLTQKFETPLLLPASTSAATTLSAGAAAATGTTTSYSPAIFNGSSDGGTVLTTAPSITYPSYRLAIRNLENCSALFANYTQPQQGTFCNWTWDQFLCWPPTPAGVLARMHCPSAGRGIDTRKFATRKCELDGHWGGRPNESFNPIGWTDYQSCFPKEVTNLLNTIKDPELLIEIAQRTRTLEIVGLILSLFALILSLIIFYNFRSLRNNRTKIHKNLFFAMVLQVVVRLTLYLDQAFRRGRAKAATTPNSPGIENTPYLCESSYVLLEYARTAMFMWMFIEGLYLHNMVTVAVFQGRFPHTIFSLLGWGVPIIMTTIWAICTAVYMDGANDCFWNYNLTPYYWILEGPRLIVILLNFFFLMNIIRVLVVKLRQSQASDIEQTRKAVRAAIVLLPLLGITNLLHLVPALNFTPWNFALWSYCTHFLTSFQGFFIALIYCFLNGEVRAVLLKSLSVYMSVRGHPDWVPKRASLFSGAYNTAPDTEAQAQQDGKRNDSPPNYNKRQNGRKSSTIHNNLNPRTHITTRLSNSSDYRRHQANGRRRSSSGNGSAGAGANSNWMFTLCFRGHKNKCVMSSKKMPPQIFMTTKPNALV